MRQLLLTIGAAVLLVSACSAGESEPTPSHAELSEASMNFDSEGVLPFLQRVADLVEGFSAIQAQTIAGEIAGMPIESERTWTIAVRFRGMEVPFQVHAFMDDTDAPDLAFFTTPELAAEIEQAMTTYAEERGL